MSWKYEAMQEPLYDGMWAMHEVYSEECYTIEAILPLGETREELLAELKMMVADLESQLKDS